jgi:hypothetical protein
MNVNTTDLKTKATKLAGWIKHQPKALLIPVALFVAIALATGFHHYVQRSKAAELKVAGITADAGNATGEYLPGMQPPAGLNEDAAQQVTACPGAPNKTAVIQTMEATFTVPANTPFGCVVTWRFYSQAVPDYSWAEDRKTGVKHALVELDASGTPAADITLTVDSVSVHNRHQARDELGSALSPRDVLAGWHSYSIVVRTMPAPPAQQGPWRGDPKPLQISLRVGHPIASPYWSAVASTASSNAIPHIAQQAPTGAGTVATIALPPPAIEPPAGVQAGHITRKLYQGDRFGQFALVSTHIEDSQGFTVTAPGRAGNMPPQRVEWSAWFKLPTPASVALLRVAGGQGTVGASVDGIPLGQPQERWPQSPPTQQVASVNLAAGWHQVTITDDEAAGNWNEGASIQLAIGDGSADPHPPQPWAVPPSGSAASTPIPHITQRRADAPAPASASSAHATASSASLISRNTTAAKPAASTTTGDTQ